MTSLSPRPLGGRLKALWARIYHAETEPHALAMGFALGLFVATLPLVGLQTILAAVLALPLRANKAAAVGLSLLSNPFTMVPLFSFNYWVGTFLVAEDSTESKAIRLLFQDFKWNRLVDAGGDIIYPLGLGSLVVGAAAAVPAYFLVRFVASRRAKVSLSTPK